MAPAAQTMSQALADTNIRPPVVPIISNVTARAVAEKVGFDRRGNKLYFKITVPGNEKFLAYSEVWYTSSYKAPLARIAAERS